MPRYRTLKHSLRGMPPEAWRRLWDDAIAAREGPLAQASSGWREHAEDVVMSLIWHGEDACLATLTRDDLVPLLRWETHGVREMVVATLHRVLR